MTIRRRSGRTAGDQMMSTDPRMTHVEGRLQEMEKWRSDAGALVPFHARS